MPFIYSIDKAARIVTVQCSGESPQFVDFKITMETVFKDSNYDTGFTFLLDRHLVDEPPSTDCIRRSVDLFRKHEAKLNCLAVVVKNMATFGMVRMAQLLAEDVDIDLQVFNDIEEAKRWLQPHEST